MAMNTKISGKLETFFTKFKHQIYRKGEVLIRVDDEPSGIFYLKKGFIKEYAISKKGDELAISALRFL